MIPIIAIPPTTAPATIPPIGTDDEDEEATSEVGTGELLVTLGYFINDNILGSQQSRRLLL